MGFWSSVGDGLSSVSSAVGDAVEGAVDTVADAVEDTVDVVIDGAQGGLSRGAEWICKVDGRVGCGAVNVVGGILDGLLEGGQSILDNVFGAVRDLGGVAGSILRLDLPGLLHDYGSFLVNILSGYVKLVRFVIGGYAVGGVVKYFKRSQLMNHVANLLDQRFGDDADLLERARDHVGLNSDQRFGLPVSAEHRVFTLDSRDVELWRMHREGKIDLYAMAGLLSFDSFQIGVDHPDSEVRLVLPDGSDSFQPVGRSVISRHLETEGGLWRLRVYPMSKGRVAERLQLATRKLHDLGIRLDWAEPQRFAAFRGRNRQLITEDEYDIDYSKLPKLLDEDEYDRPRTNCSVLAFLAFTSQHFGLSVGKDINDCLGTPPLTDQRSCTSEFGLQVNRNDLCCQTLLPCSRSAVIYRDVYPEQAFQYVLPHEVGHFMGLCHCGHDGIQNIMFRPDVVSVWDRGLFSYYYENEPHFSLDDAKNSWRFIVDQLGPCLIDSPPSISSSPDLTAVVGREYTYQPTVDGGTPIGWCLDVGPDGMTIDVATGALSWVPDSDAGEHVVLAAVNAVRADVQSFDIEVSRVVID